MQSIRNVARLNEAELEKCIPPNASWHTDYRDTAYIYIGGIPFEMSEGDVLTIFSQYGNPVDIKMARDKDTGKSRGFGWLKYEDQRSCDLAVDNLSGAGVLRKVLSVDHTRYQKKEGEVETVGEEEVEDKNASDEGHHRRRRRSRSTSEEKPMIREQLELMELEREHDDDDPMKAYLIQEKKAEVMEALKHARRDRDKERKPRHRHKHRPRKESDSDDATKDEKARRSKNR